MTLQWGGSIYEWTNAVTIVLLCASVGSFALFAVWEKFVGENAMFPYSMLRKRVIWASCLTMFLLQGSALIYLYYLPIYFQAVKGASPLSSGLYNSPGIGSQMLLAAVSSVLGKLFWELGPVLQLLNWHSREDGILSSVGPCKRNSRSCWVGLDIDFQTRDQPRRLDQLPDHCWSWARVWYNNGKRYLSARYLTDADSFLSSAYGGDAKYPLTRTNSTWHVSDSILPIVRRFHVPHVRTSHLRLQSCRWSKEICTHSRYTKGDRCWGCWPTKCGAA
jgi:hypothetical protein